MQGTPTSGSGLHARRQRLAEALFPGAPAGGSGFGHTEAAILVTAVLVLGTVLALLRLGLADALTTVWAEDGPIYLQASLTQGFWHAVFSPYAGYLVLVPRLIAEVGAAVPLRYAPAAVAIVSAAFAALSGLVVWYASAGHVRSPYLRAILALLTAFAPAAGQETLVSAAYVPWYMLAASFWLLVWRPATTRGAVLGGLFLLLTGLSTPGLWFFLPLAALRALAIRDRRDGIVVGSYALAAAVQIPVVLSQEQGEPLWTSDIWTALVQRVLDGGIFGQRLGGNLWAELGWPFLIALMVALAVGIGIGLWRAGTGARWFALLAIPTSLAMFVVSAYQRTVGPNLIWSEGTSGGTASRYVLVPALLLVSALVVLIDSSLRRRAVRATRAAWAVAATVAVLAVGLVISFDMGDTTYRGAPYWEDALEQAADKCIANDEELAGIAAAPPPFGLQIPCDQVASFATRPSAR